MHIIIIIPCIGSCGMLGHLRILPDLIRITA
uniref:Uncharacterized protein n=1 Tax=Arundo donax TaxID=35708 RepID=A0A0A9G884_ARUDO